MRIFIFFAAAVLAASPAAGSQQGGVSIAAPHAEIGAWGVDLSNRDPSVAPGKDFFRYANGKWLASYQLKPDENRYGAFIALRYLSEDRVKEIIDEAAAGSSPAGSVEQKIGDYFASYMDMKARDAKGIAPLRPALERIDAISSKNDLIDAFGRNEVEGTNAPFVAEIDIDNKNPDRYILNVTQAGLGLPDREYYLDKAERFGKIREAYRAHIARMLQLTGWDQERAAAAAERVFALETQIAIHHWPRTDLRDRDKTYNLYTFDKLESDFPGYDWLRHLHAQDVDGVKELIVATPTAITPLIGLVNTTPIDTWKEYLRYHLITGNAEYLSQEIDDANFAFYGKVLKGQEVQRDRWKRAVNTVGNLRGLGEAIGQVYVQRYFPPESKHMMQDLVENLRTAFRERIGALEWMGEDTRKEALAKLAAFHPKIGYPDKWRDLSEIEITRDDLFANVQSVRAYFHAYDMARLKRPTDKDEWFMTPQTVNAYYNPSFNEIVFPAAILQPPFFDPNADPAVNYGAIGAVIGHEMGHGFDDQGSKVDAQGVQRNWWTDEDRRRFEARTKELVAQYNQYSPVPGETVNGEFTQGENIGDLGGLSIAYHAYKLALKGKQAPVIDGLTGDQRFFLSWAQVWRSKGRDQYMVMRLKSDPHSPEEFRVNGIVRNMDTWYAAFNVKPGDAMYIAPDRRVSIW